MFSSMWFCKKCQISKKQISLLGIFILLFINCSSQSNIGKIDSKKYGKAIQYSHHYLKSAMKKTGTIGMTIVVVDSDDVVYSECFGYADLEKKIPVTDSTTFMIGSTSKLFTATAIMQMVEKGRICLDSPITAYIPEFKVKSRFNSPQITVRDLLTHESGLPCDIVNGQMIGNTKCDGADTMYRSVVALCEKEFVAYPPRTVFSYSNIGFSLLGVIIERISKRSYSEYIQDSIFNRLGMNNSFVGFDHGKVKNTFSRGYIGKIEEKPLYIRDVPAGSIVSSSADFALFVRMLFGGGSLDQAHILNENTLQQMWTPQNTDIPLDFYPIGLSYWLINQTRIAEPIISHEGTIPPFHTIFAAIPDSRLGIFLTVNSEQGSFITEDAGYKILENFYMAKTGRKLNKTKAKNTKIVKLPAKKLNVLAGYYQTSRGTAKMQRKDDYLLFSLYGKPVRLLTLSDTTFHIQYRLFNLIPVPLKQFKEKILEFHSINGHDIILIRSEGKISGYFGEKFVPVIAPQEWIHRTGNYEAVNEYKTAFFNKESEQKYRMGSYSLSYDSTTHILSINGIPLRVLSATDAVTCGYGRYASETVRSFTCKGEEYLWGWGYALKRTKKTD